MAAITITIPNPVLTRVIDGLALGHGWKPFIDDGNGNIIPNPESKTDYAKRIVKEYVKKSVIRYEAGLAEKAAKIAAEADEAALSGVVVE